MTQQIWNEKTKRITQAVLLYWILIVVDGVMSLYQIIQIFDGISRARGLGDFVSAIFGSVGPEDIVIIVLLFASYVWLVNTIKSFGSVQEDLQTRLSLEKVGSALWLNYAASIVALIPFLGFTMLIALIMKIISYAQMMSAFKYMMYSPVFDAQARSGAGTLKSYSVWSIWALVPFIGIPCGIIAWIQFIRGWSKMHRGAPVEVAPIQPQVNVSINTGYQEQNQSPSDAYMEKARAKTDEELKSILQHKDDYNQQLVKAAEQVVLERITGVSAVAISSTSQAIASITTSSTPLSEDEKYKAYQPSFVKEESIRQTEQQTAQQTKEQTEEQQKERVLTEDSDEKHIAAGDTPATPAITSTVSDDMPATSVRKSNSALIISLVVVVLLLAGSALTYFLWYVPYAKDRDALRTYVIANNLFLRSSQVAGVEYNVLNKVPYGAELITYEIMHDWAKVKVNGQEGYVSSPYVINSEDFLLLNGAWGDVDSKECIESTKCRLAILDFYKANRYASGANGWQIYTRMQGQKPNTVFYPRLYDKNSKFTDFVFILKNNQGGNRMMVGYSFEDETEKPIFRFSVGIPENGYIENIRLVRGEALVTLDTGYSFKFSL